MNSLVSYESSSDGEEGEKPLPAPPVTERPALNGDPLRHNHDPNVRTADDHDDDSKPMIGPSMSYALPEQDDGNGHSPQLPDDLSEQDLVRFLTQASHPLTELPPSPPGSPNSQVEAKFKRFLELKSKGVHFNDDLAKKTTFKNPALLSILTERAGIEPDAQYATSLPASIWDPQSLPSFAYKEELLRSQQAIRDQEGARKKQASAAGKRTIEFTAASRSGASSHASTPG